MKIFKIKQLNYKSEKSKVKHVFTVNVCLNKEYCQCWL